MIHPEIEKILESFKGLTLFENIESKPVRDIHNKLMNEIDLACLTPEIVYKEIKENIVFDFETILDYGGNKIDKEIQTDWGLIKVSFLIGFSHDGEYNKVDLHDVCNVEVYNNEGHYVKMDFSFYPLMDSLKHLNIKY